MRPRIVSLRRFVGFIAAGAFACGLSGIAKAQLLDEETNQKKPPYLSALHLEIQTQSEKRSSLQAAYADRFFEPIWFDDSGRLNARGEALLKALRASAQHALPPARYRADRIEAALLDLGPKPGPRDIATIEAELSEAFVLYARDLNSGLLEPRRVDRELHVYPARPDGSELLHQAGKTADFTGFLSGLAPQGQEYAALIARYAELRQIAAAGGWGPKVPKGKTLEEGDRSDRVPMLRMRLHALGFLPASALERFEPTSEVVAANEVVSDAPKPSLTPDPRLFDAELAAAVRVFQERHGLNADGLVGPATLGALNTTAKFRARQVAVNLERLRWLNRDLGDPRVMVNLAGFTMSYIENGAPRFTSRVVVGKARRFRTPEFSDELEYIVVNPVWNVPRSIARNEILPKLQENPNYLVENNMDLVGTDLDPASIDWASVTPSDFPGKVKQRPGSGNALGHVKFLFPNDFSIYLHDTPSRSLFAKDMRAYSHGCVRVEKPVEFAHVLLSAQSDDPAGLFQSLRDSGRERWVTLERKVPVHLTYRTAWIDDEGNLQFRQDIYGRDRRIIAALEAAGVDL